jgi:hypothetical protein
MLMKQAPTRNEWLLTSNYGNRLSPHIPKSSMQEVWDWSISELVGHTAKTNIGKRMYSLVSFPVIHPTTANLP